MNNKNEINKVNKYNVILNCPHWEPTSTTPTGKLKHPRMDLVERSAMFAPFAALSGYDEAIEETARLTNRETELSDSKKE